MEFSDTAKGDAGMKGASQATALYTAFFDGLSPSQRGLLAHTKRFFEAWFGFPELRDSVAAAARGEASFDAIRDTWDLACNVEELLPWLGIVDLPPESDTPPEALTLFRDHRDTLLALRRTIRGAGDTNGTNVDFDRWRARNMHRCDGELGEAGGAAITHPVISFELSDGCSVGCWFCGVSAERFRGNWSHADNRDEWRGIIAQTMSFFGPAAATAFCYWATDPSDNPDYPEFIADLAAATGVVPQTTTAAPLRNLELTRRVLAMTAQAGGLPNRFSVLSRKQLREIFRTFTPDETLHVELVMQMTGGGPPKATSGRARLKTGRHEDLAKSMHATIACVTGYLVNLPRRQVRLVTPTPSTERIPDGYYVLGTAGFHDPASFGKALRDLASQHIRPGLSSGDPLRLRPSATFEWTDQGFAIAFGALRYTVDGGVARALGQILSSGGGRVRDAYDAGGQDPHQVFGLANALDALFDAGLLLEPHELAEPASLQPEFVLA